MFENMEYSQLQLLWWTICSIVGALFVFMTFVQGGQTLLFTETRNELEKSLIINSLGRKWELTFTTLVLFGGALFASFPLFYATSFGGAYWVWMLILFCFIIQAVSYEYRKKPDNLLGAGTYEKFLLINGSISLLLIGTAVATFYSGSGFSLNEYNQVTWHHPLRGVEAAFNFFNLSLGAFLVFLARCLGAMYLVNNIDYPHLTDRLRKAALRNLLYSLPFLLFFLGSLVSMDGFAVDPVGKIVTMESGKYLHNLLAVPRLLFALIIGLLLVIWGVYLTSRKTSDKGIWFSGLGTVLVGLVVFMLPALNNTAFYPSYVDLQSSLTIYNASSSRYTLTVMSYVALMIPLVLAYISYVWWAMDAQKLTAEEVTGDEAEEMY